MKRGLLVAVLVAFAASGCVLLKGPGPPPTTTQPLPAPAQSGNFTDFQPNEDVLFVGGAGVPNNTAGQRYTNVDEVALDAADYVEVPSVEPISSVQLGHQWRAGVAGSLAGKTITAVEVLADAAKTGAPDGFVTAQLVIGGKFHVGAQHIYALSETIARYAFTWSVNPATGGPWTVGEVEAFDATGVINIGTTWPGSRAYRYTFRVHWS